jgi:hypothetical protein
VHSCPLHRHEKPPHINDAPQPDGNPAVEWNTALASRAEVVSLWLASPHVADALVNAVLQKETFGQEAPNSASTFAALGNSVILVAWWPLESVK